MGRQSARMYFDKEDHKEVYYNGNYHKAMYLTDFLGNADLIWQKLGEDSEFEMKVVDYMADYRNGNKLEAFGDGYVSFDITGYNDSPYTIDWGDGTVEQNTMSHIYPTSNGTEYVVKIKGKVKTFRAYRSISNIVNASIFSCVVEILTPLLRSMSVTEYSEEKGQVPNLLSMFSWCYLLKKIPRNLFEKIIDFENINASGMFSYSGLEDIPQLLFVGAKNWQIDSIFSNCNNLVTINPSVFISGKYRTSSNRGIFENCKNLKYVYDYPEGVTPYFVGTPLEIIDCRFVGIESAENAFSGLSTLKQIGKDLFIGSPGITTFERCFYNCSLLREIPIGLFDGQESATNFEECFMGNTNVKSIPKDLFEDCYGAKNFIGCFRNSGITTVPLTLFDGRASGSTFRYTFSGCQQITSAVPDLWNYSNDGTECYYGCVNATNYNEIPNDWK